MSYMDNRKINNVNDVPSNCDSKMRSYVYKIMPLGRVLGLFRNNKLGLVLPDSWDDPFEEYWGKLLLKAANFDSQDKTIFGTCFTKEARSDAMWRIYSIDKLGVRIKVDFHNLCDSLREISSESLNFFVGDVQYKKDEELIQIARDSFEFSNEEILTKQWYNKRKAFSHEAEMRLMCVASGKEFRKDKVLLLDLDPRKFVYSIMLEGRLEPEIFEEIRVVLKHVSGFSLKKINQSELYKLPLALREK